MSNTTRWFGDGMGTVVRSLTAPLRLPSSARAAPAAIAATARTNAESVNQHLRIMVGPSLSIVVDVVDDGQSVWVVAYAGDRRDLPARTQIDHEDRAAGRSGGRLPGASGHDGVPAVGSHRGPLRARRLTVGTDEGDPLLGARLVTQRLRQVHDRNVVGAEIGHHDAPAVGRPGDREWSRPGAGVVGADLDASGLGVGRTLSGAVDVDDRDRVAFEIHPIALSSRHRDELAVWTGLD